MNLLDEEISLSNISSDSVYSLRKIKYNFRLIIRIKRLVTMSTISERYRGT